MASEIAWLVGGLIVGAVAIWLAMRGRGGSDSKTVASRLDQITQHLDARLQENVAAINETKSFVTDRVSSNERAVREVGAKNDQTMRELNTRLGRLDQATNTLHQANQEIVSFQNMLKHPKIRGGFGEVLLGNLLADVLPNDRYQLQHRMASTGEIADAVVLLQDGYLVAVDAKFPLANYQTYIQAEDADRRLALRKIFLRDIKKHISDISGKYISPQHQTLDFAFMYIPVEAVYYETMVHDKEGETLWEFALAQKVIPVSPNSFLAYLQTVLIGLRGLQIEEQAKDILQALGQIRQDFTAYSKDFSSIGSHLNNAKNRYDDSARRLDKLNNRLDQIDTSPNTAASLPAQSPE